MLMRSAAEPSDRPLPLSVWRGRAKARARRAEYLARAYRCGDMAARASSAHDAQFLRAMTIVWQALADRDADVPNAAERGTI